MSHLRPLPGLLPSETLPASAPRPTRGQHVPGLIPTPLPTVEGGQRAIFFNRIGGVQQDTILAEGLHFR